MDGTTGYYSKQNKSVRERQVPHDLTHMWNLRNKTEDHRGRERKIKQDEIREEINHKKLLTTGDKLRVAGGEGVGNRVTG